MAFKMPETFEIQVKGVTETRSRTRLSARGHELLVDEPEARHGTDRAPTPLETLLSSFLACTNVIANVVAEERGIDIRGMDFDLVAHFDTRGVFAKAEVTVPFPVIEVTVTVDADISDHQLDALREDVAKRCPVSVILRGAGSDVRDRWRLGGVAADP